MSGTRYVYNLAVAQIKKYGVKYFRDYASEKRKQSGKKHTNSQVFRDYILSLNLPDWVKEVPFNPKGTAIEDAWNAALQASTVDGESEV